MNVTLRRSVAAFLAIASSSALAVNYPTELRVGVTDSMTGPPLVLVHFMNNEGDTVKFVFEAMFDGVVQPHWPTPFNGDAACTRSADANSCNGVPNVQRIGWSSTKGHRAVEVLRIQRDTEYCFRIKATDGVHDSAWTPRVCARTPPLPRRPALAPKQPQVTLLESGTNGRGDVGPAKPGRVLIEWQPMGEASWFEVERAEAVASPAAPFWTHVGRVTPASGWRGGDLELVESIADPKRLPGPDRRVSYRVCAANIGGKTCSTSGSYPPAYVKQAIDNAPPPSRTPPRPMSVSQAGAPAALRLAAPQILSPAQGSSVVQGQLRLQVGATPGTENSQVEVEFSRREPRRQTAGGLPNAAAATTVWTAPMAALTKGELVPPGAGPTQAGVWVARVRVVRGSIPDQWSEPVSFTLSLPGWAKATTPAVRADSAARSIAAPPAAPLVPPQKAPTAMTASPGSSLDKSKAAPSAFGAPSPRPQP